MKKKKKTTKNKIFVLEGKKLHSTCCTKPRDKAKSWLTTLTLITQMSLRRWFKLTVQHKPIDFFKELLSKTCNAYSTSVT